MKRLMDAIDRFCYRHPRFGIPNLMLYIVIGNAIIWLFGMMDRSGTLISLLRFSPYDILRGQVWRLVTFLLIPQNTSLLAVLFFYFYYLIGRTLEMQWGAGKLTIYVFSGALLSVLYCFLIYAIFRINLELDARFIYLSLFFPFATLFPDMQVLLFFIIPIKMKWLAIVDAGLFLLEVVFLPFPHKLLPLVAILNYLVFCGDWLLDYFRPQSVARRKNVINFRAEARRIRKMRENQPYSRRCEVCGRTDAEYPDLEFRYCSRCQGYHCFCMDHINNHRHFTQ